MGIIGTAGKKALAVVFAATLFAGCSDEGTPQVAIVADEGKVTAGDPIPAPESKSILKVSGAITQKNSGETLRLDMATLEEMPIVEVTIYEPFVKTDVTFSGVMMDDFLEVIGADPEAGGVHMTALDDFTADLPMSELTSGSILLATRQDGEPLKVRAGGPARIVFLNDDGIGSNTDMWIWSVALMDVHS